MFPLYVMKTYKGWETKNTMYIKFNTIASCNRKIDKSQDWVEEYL